MKKTVKLIAIFILVNSNYLVAQKPLVKVKLIKEAVKITYPSKRSVHLLSTYFTSAITKKILTQITTKQLANVKIYCEEEVYPSCIKDKLAYNPAKPEEDASEATLNSLKLYRIAKFNNIRNGENFGEESILIAPAPENKNVGGDCNYDKDFYIIIPSSAIELIK